MAKITIPKDMYDNLQVLGEYRGNSATRQALIILGAGIWIELRKMADEKHDIARERKETMQRLDTVKNLVFGPQPPPGTVRAPAANTVPVPKKNSLASSSGLPEPDPRYSMTE